MKPKPVLPVRDRIFKYALREFADKGYSGARLDRIAELARTKKRMIFYYFKSKEGLFTSVMESAWAQVPEVLDIRPEEILPFWCAFSLRNREWARIQIWERSDGKLRKIMNEDKRRSYWRKEIEKIDQWRPTRKKCIPISSAHLLLLMLGIETIPIAYPNLVKLLIGKDLSDPKFQPEWIEVCKTVGEFLIGGEDRPLAEKAP